MLLLQVTSDVNRSSFHIYLKHEINMNEQHNVFYFNAHNFLLFKSTEFNLLFCLICMLGKMDGFSVMIGQIACQSSSLQTVNCGLAFFARSDGLKVKMPSWGICFLQILNLSLHKMLIDGLELCNLWIIVRFLSVNSLQRIHWWATDTFLQIYCDEETKSHLRWPEGEYIFSTFSLLGELFLEIVSV